MRSSLGMTNDGKTDKSREFTRLRVCLVSGVPPPFGGMPRWTMLIHRWASSEPRISIVQVDISVRWRAIYDVVVWKRVIGGSLQLLRDYWRFITSVRGADVVHLVTSGQFAVVRDLVICITAKLLKLPVVYHIHFGRVPDIARFNTLEWRMLSRSMQLATAIFPLDEATACTLHKHLPHKLIEIVPNAIDLATLLAPSPQRSTKKSLLFLGWVLPSKGVEDLLAAWNDLDQDDWELVIAGPRNPAYQLDLMDRFTKHGVRFAGEVPHNEALQLIADCDIFVLPSHTEAFPFVVLEAMALGKAIVATDVGAIPEMLAGECGLLVKSKNVQGLARALKTLIDNDELRADMGRRAHERVVANYTADAVFNRLMSLWHQVAKREEDGC